MLSNAAFSRPAFDDPAADRPKKFSRSAGGPSNTGTPQSYTVALSGEEIPGADGLAYHHAGGAANLRRNYVIEGASLAIGDWEIAAAGGGRRSHTTDDGVVAWDNQYNFTVGYELFENFRLNAGLNRIRIDRRPSNTLGLNASYGFSF